MHIHLPRNDIETDLTAWKQGAHQGLHRPHRRRVITDDRLQILDQSPMRLFVTTQRTPHVNVSDDQTC